MSEKIVTETAEQNTLKDKHSWIDDIIGVIPNSDINEKEFKSERLMQKHSSQNSSSHLQISSKF